MSKKNSAVSLVEFGHDHWSTFIYAESRAVDHAGRLKPDQLRQDGAAYPTRLRGGKHKRNHNDLDCIADLEAAGLLRNNGTGLAPVVELTPEGWRVAGQLRQWKARGERYADFVPVLS